MARPSIYEFAGGSPAFLALAADHPERYLQDSELNQPFSHGVNPEPQWSWNGPEEPPG